MEDLLQNGSAKGDSDVNTAVENNDAVLSKAIGNISSSEVIKAKESCAEVEICHSEEKNVSDVEVIDFKVIFNKNKYDISFGWDRTIKDLKQLLERVTGVPQNAQKLMIKGMAKDDMTLKSAGLTKGGKVMVVGSKIDDILAVTSVSSQVMMEEKLASQSSKEPLSLQKIHRKVLDKGVPPDVMPGIKDTKDSLPPIPLSGMLNKHGGKVRLTFKAEQDQIWISTKERTEKLPMTSIKSVISEPIKEHEEYHIMALQLGPTEASRYWVYWVPAQYVEAIKDTVFGKWQYF